MYFSFTEGERNKERDKFASVVNGDIKDVPVVIKNLFPKFIKVTNKGLAQYVKELARECSIAWQFRRATIYSVFKVL